MAFIKKLFFCTALIVSVLAGRSQSFLNGDFENTTATFDQINLSNAAFNAEMPFDTGFGTRGNLDIISSSLYSGGGPEHGKWYVGLTGAGSDQLSLKLSAPLTAGNNYTISFYTRKNTTQNSYPVQIGLSTSATSLGTAIYTSPVALTDVWTQNIFSFTAPNNGQFITVMMTCCSYLDWVNLDNFSFACQHNLGPDTTLCAGATYLLDASTPGATSYLWQDGSTGPTYLVTAPGLYWTQVTTPSCSGTDSVNIKYYPSVTDTITAGGPTTFCQGDSVMLSSLPGSNYLWTTGETTQSIEVSNSGNYQVTITGAHACSAPSAATTVTVNSLPNAGISASGPLTICQGSSVTLTVSFNTIIRQDYNWSDGENSQSIVVDSAGTYYVTVSANGCSAVSAPEVITVNPAPAASVTPDGPLTFCTGSSVTLTASINKSYLWNSGPTTQAITVTGSGSYDVTVTDSAGCRAISPATVVKVNPLPVATIAASGPTTFCKGDSLELTAKAGSGYHYSWSTTATTEAIKVTTSGSYIVTVTNANQCSKTSAAKKITVNALPAVSITTKGSICAGGTEILTAKKIGSDTYKWSTGATTNIIDATVAGTYIVTVSNTKCSAEASSFVSCATDPATEDNKTTGADDISAANDNSNLQASVYPNPGTGSFHLKLQSNKTGNLTIRVYDVNGKLITEKLNISYTTDIILNNNYAAGVYVVRVGQGNVSRQVRFVKVAE